MKKFLLSLVAIISATTFAFADTSGQCGPNVTYNYYVDSKQLTLSGYGPMDDFNSGYSPAPWNKRLVEKVVMTGSITTIGNDAFDTQHSLTEFTFCSSVESIGAEAFSNCYGLENITLPNNLEQIKKYAFENCEKLSRINIPAKVNSIGEGAFRACTSLTKFTVVSTNQYYIADNGVLYNKPKTELLFFPAADENKRTSYTVPYGVITIGEFAFYRAAKLQSIELPPTVKELAYNALSSPNLTSITCPCKVPPTASLAFGDTPTSTTIIVPTGATAAYKAASGWSKFTNYVEKDFPEIIDPTCAVPTNLALVGEPSFSTAEITWTPGSNEQAGWGFRYKKASESEYQTYPNRIANTGASSYSINLINLEPNTTYNVVAFGVCGDDVEDYIISENSAVLTFTTADVPAEQTTPTVDNDWVYYGTNTFGLDIEIVENPYWGIMIPTNTAVSKYLDTVKVYASNLDKLELAVYTGGNTPDKATKVWSQNVQPTDLNQLNELALLEPIEYSKSKTMWIFFRHAQAFNNPMAASADANAPNARWIGIPAGDKINWMDVKDYDSQYTYFAWLIDAHFTAKPVYHPYAKDLVAKKVNNNSVTLGWTGRADKFEVRYRKVANPDEEWNLKINITSKSTTISKLEAEKNYEFQVRAKLGDNYSDWSEVLNVFTEDKVAIDQVLEEKAPSTKFMKDGQLFILHDGKIYNASGFRVQ